MLVSRRFSRPLTLVCATAALAVAPGTAIAMPATDSATLESDPATFSIDPPAAPEVREIRTGADTTLALIFSGTALIIAAGGAGLAGRDHQRIRQIIS
jgi:hypothetical protein